MWEQKPSHIPLSFFSGAGKNHQMFHLDIINYYFSRKIRRTVSIPAPRQSAGWEDMSFAVCVHSTPFFVPLLPIIGSGSSGWQVKKRNSIKSDQHLIKMGGSAIQFQIQVCQNPKLPDRSVAFKIPTTFFRQTLGLVLRRIIRESAKTPAPPP